MVLIREVFNCKPGKVRPLVEMFHKMNKLGPKHGFPPMRLMTDLSAERYWTVVSEWEVASLGEFERLMGQTMADKELEEIMKNYHDLVDHGRREIYKIEKP
jgi:hypothetical protein